MYKTSRRTFLYLLFAVVVSAASSFAQNLARTGEKLSGEIIGYAPVESNGLILMKGYRVTVEWWEQGGQPRENFRVEWLKHAGRGRIVERKPGEVYREDLQDRPELLRRFDQLTPVGLNIALKGYVPPLLNFLAKGKEVGEYYAFKKGLNLVRNVSEARGYGSQESKIDAWADFIRFGRFHDSIIESSIRIMFGKINQGWLEVEFLRLDWGQAELQNLAIGIGGSGVSERDSDRDGNPDRFEFDHAPFFRR